MAGMGRRGCIALLIPVEVSGWLLLEPETVVLGRLLEEVRRLLEHVVVLVPRAGGRRGARLERLVRRYFVLVLVEPRVLVVARRLRGRRFLGDARLPLGELVDGRGLLEGRRLVDRRRRGFRLWGDLGLGLGRRLRGALRLRELVALPRTERLLFLARDIVRIGSVFALEL